MSTLEQYKFAAERFARIAHFFGANQLFQINRFLGGFKIFASAESTVDTIVRKHSLLPRADALYALPSSMENKEHRYVPYVAITTTSATKPLGVYVCIVIACGHALIVLIEFNVSRMTTYNIAARAVHWQWPRGHH
eukprot:1742040-Pleurochrysis_carterae.AAC.1